MDNEQYSERLKVVKAISDNFNGQISIEWLKKHILKITREDEIKWKREERIKKLNEIYKKEKNRNLNEYN